MKNFGKDHDWKQLLIYFRQSAISQKNSVFMKGFSNCFQIVNVRLLLHLFTIPKASKNNNISWLAFFIKQKTLLLNCEYNTTSNL